MNEMALKDAIKRLPDREKEIIKLRYFDGKTQMEVSKMVRISQAQVSRLEKSAIKIWKLSAPRLILPIISDKICT